MNEDDDGFFNLMISKEKGMFLNLDSEEAKNNILKDMPTYNYLRERKLIVPEKWEEFCDNIKDLYHLISEEYYEKYGEVIMPSPYDISDLLDEENANIIALFISNDEDKRDNVITIYASNTSNELPYSVIEALNVLGLPFKNGDNSIIGSAKITSKGFYDPYQQKMFGGDLYD